MLGVIFRTAQKRNPRSAKLRRLIVDLMGQEDWMILDADVKGDLYEGLLEKNAADLKSGASQCFTPRSLARPRPEFGDPVPDQRKSDATNLAPRDCHAKLRIRRELFAKLRTTRSPTSTGEGDGAAINLRNYLRPEPAS